MKIKVKKFDTEVEVNMPLYNKEGKGICLGDVIEEIIDGITRANFVHKRKKTAEPKHEEFPKDSFNVWKLRPDEMPAFETREDAEKFLLLVAEEMNSYGCFSVQDMKDTIDHSAVPDCRLKNFGWRPHSLPDIKITVIENSPLPYHIVFPLAEKL